ncbi:unnamed protein product [Scytosiphon promiscuus]
MASYEQVDHTWTRRQMKAECHQRGLRSYARLNKDQLIRFLNRNLDANTSTTRAVVVPVASQAVVDSDRAAPSSGRATGNSNEPPSRPDDRAISASGRTVSSSQRAASLEEGRRRIDDSWTVRELKAECGRRGLRRFARLTKPDLLALLRRGSSVSVAPPPEGSGGDAERRLQSVSDLKERADDAFRSSQFTLALELSLQAIGLLNEAALIHVAGPLENQTRALLLAIRAEARAILGITVEARRDCGEALRLNPDLSKMLLLKARLDMRLCEWELATQNFQAYLVTDGVSDASRREATAELEQCRRTQIRSVDQQLQRMGAMLSGVRASMNRREGVTDATPGLGSSGAVDPDAPEAIGVAETGSRVDDLHGSGWSDEERGDDRAGSGGTADFSRRDSNPTQAAVPVGERSGTLAAATSDRNGSNGGSCVVCMDSTVTCTFVPCGHFCCCDSCAGRVGACPVCRSEVQRSIRTFMP